MSLSKLSFADELVRRIAPRQVLFFLRVVKRGLEFPLHNTSIDYRRVFLVPNMILAVVAVDDNCLVVEWHGPTLETEYKNSKDTPAYSERVSFTIDIANSYLEDGSVIRIDPSAVVKMANHVPAVLY